MDPDQLPTLPNPFVTLIIAAIITAAVVIGDRINESHRDYFAKAVERGDRHGTINLTWYKLKPLEVTIFCDDTEAEVCSTYKPDTDTCVILSSDKEELLTDIGKAFMSCVAKNESARVIIPNPMKALKMSYWFTVPWLMDEMCRDIVAGCTQTSKNLIITEFPSRDKNYETVGHEIKHLIDGAWHNRFGIPHGDAFEHKGV